MAKEVVVGRGIGKPLTLDDGTDSEGSVIMDRTWFWWCGATDGFVEWLEIRLVSYPLSCGGIHYH